ATVPPPAPIEGPPVNSGVLALAFVFEAVSWHISHRAFRAAKGDAGYWAAFRASKDPPAFIVLFEDTAARVGIVVAAAATWLSDAHGLRLAEGRASRLIG